MQAKVTFMTLDRFFVGLAVLASAAVIGLAIAGDGLLRRPIRIPSPDQRPSPPNESLSFFSERNKTELQVPHAMTVEELLLLFKLESNRAEILQQLGSRDSRTTVMAGRVLTVTLTPVLAPVRRELVP
jgi:hypothetical protein